MTPDAPAAPSRAEAFTALMAFWQAAGLDTAHAEALAKLPPPAPQRAAPPAKPAASDALTEARRAAASATDLVTLAEAVAAYDGCGLKKTARQAVVFDGVLTAPIVVIGEAPGADEDRIGKPFVGRSGQLLDRMFASIGLSRTENLLITNMVFWRPPGNRTPYPGEISACAPFLARLLALTAPKAVLLIGAVAAKAMLAREEGVMRLRGKPHAMPPLPDMASVGFTKSLNAMVTLHPSYLLRRPQEKALAWADLQTIEAWLTSLSVINKGEGTV